MGPIMYLIAQYLEFFLIVIWSYVISVNMDLLWRKFVMLCEYPALYSGTSL